jgi:hypothetical protein
MSWDVQSIGMGTGTDHSLWIGGFPQKYIPGKLSMQEEHEPSQNLLTGRGYQLWGQASCTERVVPEKERRTRCAMLKSPSG